MLTWIAMLYCAGVGSNLIYWSIVEPIYYLQAPPFGLAAGSAPAAEWAAAYGPFHWGLTAWALYCIATVPIAYSYHVRKETKLTFSMASRSVLGRHAEGLPGKAMDVAVMFGIMGGVGTGGAITGGVGCASTAGFVGTAGGSRADAGNVRGVFLFPVDGRFLCFLLVWIEGISC